jgi:hypothetical protein
VGERRYEVAKRGLATNFVETELPLDYALKFRNRFVNASGGAEKRRGIVSLTAVVPSREIVTGVHEYVSTNQDPRLFATAAGIIFRHEPATDTWAQVYSFTTAARVRAVQFDDKLIFWNGFDRQVFIDAVSAAPARLQALMEEGTTGASTSAAAVTDADVTNWVTGTFVTTGDIVFNVLRGTYGIVTAATSSRISHTPMSAAAVGFGNTLTPVSGVGIGGEPTLGEAYRVFDSIELNIVSNAGISDNVGTIITASAVGTETYITVSADRVPDWSVSQARPGDVVHNTTRNNGSFISRIVSSGIFVSPALTNAIAGDSLVFYKSAMPIADWIHPHYGRLWMIDARNPREIIASGPNDPQDFTVDSSSLETVTIQIGSQQPGADPALTLATFQTYLMVGTAKNVMAFRGTVPSEMEPAGLFPQGVVSPDAFVNTGNDLAFVAPDGLLSVSLLTNSSNLQRSNLSEPIKNRLRTIIEAIGDDDGAIIALNYQRRSWVIVKIGSSWYIYNYSNFLLEDGRLAAGASWSEFDGFIGSLRCMMARSNNDIILGGAGGKVYTFDGNTFTDDGVLYTTEYVPGWLTLEEPKSSTRMKSGTFIVPQFEVGGQVIYTIEAQGNAEQSSLDSVTVTARDDDGGRPIGTFTIGTDNIGEGKTVGQKVPLAWRGTRFRLGFKTKDSAGPDVLASFFIYGKVHGRK